MLPGSSFDVRPAVDPADAVQAAVVRELIRGHARDEEDEMRLLDMLGLAWLWLMTTLAVERCYHEHPYR